MENYAKELDSHVRHVLLAYLTEVEDECFCWQGTGSCYHSKQMCMSHDGVTKLHNLIIIILQNHINTSKYRNGCYDNPEIINTIRNFINYIQEGSSVDSLLYYVEDMGNPFKSFGILYPNLTDICDQIKKAGGNRISSNVPMPTSEKFHTYYAKLFYPHM